eukprot:SAG31_NODE_2581_length_5436_cov_3.876897_3_plen_731_part_00
MLHFVEGVGIFGVQNGTTWQLRSTDSGHSFLPRERVDASFPLGYHGIYPGPGAGIVLSPKSKHPGRLLFPAFVFHGPSYYPTLETTLLYYSDDGRTFHVSVSKHTHQRPNDQFDEAAVVERADGSLLLSIRGNYSMKNHTAHARSPYRMQALSHDGGSTFGEFAFATELPDPSCQASLLSLPSCGPLHGNVDNDTDSAMPCRSCPPLLAFCNPANASSRQQLTVRTSSDGQSWDAGQLIWKLPSAYSSMALPTVSRPRDIAVAFEQYLTTDYDVKLVHIGLAKMHLAPSPLNKLKTDDGVMCVLKCSAASAAGLKTDDEHDQPCPPEWVAACPGVPCTPLTKPDPPREVMAFHADYPRNSWKYYNLSILTTIITDHHETNLSCTAHKHGVKVVYFGFSDYETGHFALLHNESYRKEFVKHNINDTVTRYPWIDGINIDLEHFSRIKSSLDPSALTSLICEIQAELHARGLRLHSQDVAVRGSYGNFNVTALASCMDYILPMAYCAPESSTVAGPTIALDYLKRVFAPGKNIWGMKSNKIILGLPFFGYNFECTNSAPVPFPSHDAGSRAPICRLAQPPMYPMIDHWNAMQILRSELMEGRVTSPPGCQNVSACVGFDEVKAAAWFEYRNRTTGRRHQMWLEQPRSVHAKSQFAFSSGLHGVAMWRGNEIYGPDVKDDITGRDSEDAQDMWRAVDPKMGGYGGRGFHHPHNASPMRHIQALKIDEKVVDLE